MTRPAPRSRCSKPLAATLSLALVLTSAVAAAQPCCAGAGILSPARLKLWENAAAGVQLHAQVDPGSFDGQGRYVVNPPGTSELDFEEDAVGVVRLGHGGQLGLLIPFEQTRRQVVGLMELGGGLGDLQLFGRFDFTHTGTPGVPVGFAVLASATLPTGRPPEGARLPLGTDATGQGAYQGSVGVAFERSFGPWVFNATAALTGRTERTVGGVHSQLAPQLSAFLGAAYAFPEERALGVTASFTSRGSPIGGVGGGVGGGEGAGVGGGVAPSSAGAVSLGSSAATLSVVGSLPLWEHWRLQGSAFDQPPIPGMGQNQVAGLGFTVALLRSWI